MLPRLVAASLVSGLLALGCTGPNPAFQLGQLAGDPRADANPGPMARPEGTGDAPATTPPRMDAPVADQTMEAAPPPPPNNGPDVPGDTSGPDAGTMPADAPVAPVDMAATPRTPPTSPVVNDLLGYWPFDEPTGTVANDFSGHQRHGTVGGASQGVAWVKMGRVGGALSFPGGNSPEVGVLIPYSTMLDGLRQFTIAAFFKLDSLPGQGVHFSVMSRQLNGTNAEVFNITCNGGAVVGYIPAAASGGGQTTYEARARNTLSAGNWIHAALTYNGTSLSLYINGGAPTVSNFPNRLVSSLNTPMYIGTNKNANHSEPFHGQIDEVVLYGAPLGADAIARLARGESPLDIR